MLGKIAPSFVISRVIQNSYYAKTMSIELLKQPFGSHEHYFGMQNPSHYFVILHLILGMQILWIYFKTNTAYRVYM